MKLIILTLALIGFAAAIQVPDSATQGPNPQDIATPEPEYIDIDEPEPRSAAPARPAPLPARPAPLPARPIPQVRSSFISAPRPVQRPVAQLSQYLPPRQQPIGGAIGGHSFNIQNGYQYRRPVHVRRVHRRHY